MKDTNFSELMNKTIIDVVEDEASGEAVLQTKDGMVYHVTIVGTDTIGIQKTVDPEKIQRVWFQDLRNSNKEKKA